MIQLGVLVHIPASSHRGVNLIKYSRPALLLSKKLARNFSKLGQNGTGQRKKNGGHRSRTTLFGGNEGKAASDDGYVANNFLRRSSNSEYLFRH